MRERENELRETAALDCGIEMARIWNVVIIFIAFN